MRSKLSPLPIAIALLSLLTAAQPPPGTAMYIQADLIDVPVDRLIKNLQTLADKNPRDAAVRFNLARVHAMVYALKTDTARVAKGRENEGAWFGYEPAHVPFTATPTGDPKKLEAAREHLAKAIALYEEVLKLAPANLSAALGFAWCLQQSGDKWKAIAEYRKVIDAAWEKEGRLNNGGLGWHSITEEAGGYLIALLDKQNDEDEIRRLQARMSQLSKVPRPITPIVIPLRSGLNPSELVDRWASVAFDADGTGLKKKWTWITKDAGWLVYDPRHTGKITSALQMFGSVTFWLFWDNGYQALAALDDNFDGILSGRELRGFAIWQDLDRNGLCEPGEVKPLAEWGIAAVSCGYLSDSGRSGYVAHSPDGVSYVDGSSRPTYDVVLHPAISSLE